MFSRRLTPLIRLPSCHARGVGIHARQPRRFSGQTWTIPGSGTKGKRDHAVPMTPAIAALFSRPDGDGTRLADPVKRIVISPMSVLLQLGYRCCELGDVRGWTWRAVRSHGCAGRRCSTAGTREHKLRRRPSEPSGIPHNMPQKRPAGDGADPGPIYSAGLERWRAALPSPAVRRARPFLDESGYCITSVACKASHFRPGASVESPTPPSRH
jgi:hypothetical protein